MATVITNECINCGACEPECPNTAIYQGGVEWELNGVKHPPLSADIFYIVPEKCTECVGFHDKEACAVVCPVDCCVPDPERPETEDVLIGRSRSLHPGNEFPANFPSRFKSDGAPAPATAAAAPTSTLTPPAAPPPPPKPAAPAPVAPEPAAPAKAAPAPGPAPASAAAPAAAPAAKAPAAPAAEPKAPAVAAAVPAAPAAEPSPPLAPKPDGSALPAMEEWQVPVDCHHCKGSYAVPFRHYRSGNVLRCPSCTGSIVVTTSMHNFVAKTLREFYAQWASDFDALVDKRRRQLEAVEAALKQGREENLPPGAPRKRAWIFG